MRRSAGTYRAKLPPMVALLAVCVFALSPVEYRGGAAQPHAHTAFQLWYDVADGALDHHGHGHGNATGGSATAPSAPAGTTSAAEAPPDIPRLSALASAERTAPILVVGVASAAWAVGSIRFRPAWPLAVVLSGRAFHPEPPPPRPLVALA